MKFSVIFGVIHMCVGIVLKGMNNNFFKNSLDLFCEFFPQIIFMILTFGFMDFTIIYKWLTNWPENKAPSIITLMINMPLKLGSSVKLKKLV